MNELIKDVIIFEVNICCSFIEILKKKGLLNPIKIMKNIKNPGAAPNVIKSERESSSFPISLSNLRLLATKPSAKSNKAPRKWHKRPSPIVLQNKKLWMLVHKSNYNL